MAQDIQNPVIVIPGITGTNLRDEYPLSPQTVWELGIFPKQDFDRIALHPDNLRYERVEPSRVRSDRISDLGYQEFIDELRHDLSSQADLPTPVYPFAYDWRQPIRQTAIELAAFVDEVIERTKLLRHYHSAGYGDDNPKVDLVGHSMGGLLIAEYLATKGPDSKVGRVATIATPFRGSLESVVKVATGLTTLGGGRPSSRDRETARVTPGVYHLVPSFANALLPASPTLPVDLFDVKTWQTSILETIAEYIRMFAVEPSNSANKNLKRAEEILKTILTEAQEHRTRIEQLKLSTATCGLEPQDWLCIVGLGQATRVRMPVELDDKGKPRFGIHTDDVVDSWSADRSSLLTGDGTVPLLGACNGFLPLENLVCVSPKDFGFFELTDQVANAAAGLHATLPRMSVVQQLVISHLSGELRPRAVGRRAPGVAAWTPPIKNLPEKT